MDFSTEITIMGSALRTPGEPLVRGIQKTFRRDTIFMQDVKSFVKAVVARADGGKISRLNIHDHGNEKGCYFGKDWIKVANFADFAPSFAKINVCLTKSGRVYLGHYEMGQIPELMRMFAVTFGARVYAGTGVVSGRSLSRNPVDFVGCTPAGQIFRETRRT